jgi:hypothetical protein
MDVYHDEEEEDEEDANKTDDKGDAPQGKGEEEEEAKGYLFGKETVEERDAAAAESIALMNKNFGHIYRSKV